MLTNKQLCVKLAEYITSQVSTSDIIEEHDEIIFNTLYIVAKELIDISNSIDDFENDNY